MPHPHRPPSGFSVRIQWIGRILGPLAALSLLGVTGPETMPLAAWHMVAVAVWVVLWWLTEAIPLPATALLPLILMPLLGVESIQATASQYGHPLIFLFLGGFLLAAGMQRVGLHRRIALMIVAAVGSSANNLVLGFMLATAFLSMWISNTATTIMMYAVALSVIDFIAEQSKVPDKSHPFGIALMLAIAYAASIGGIGTLIGTPPNALLASFLESQYSVEISFAGWMLLGVPVVVILLPITWLLLTRLLFPTDGVAVDDLTQTVRRQITELGPISRGEILVAVLFLGTAAAWMLRVPLVQFTGLPLNDAMIAMTAALVMFLCPIPGQKGRSILDWEVAPMLPWGILLLFGGGLALASGFASSGLAEWIAVAVSGVEVPVFLLVAAVMGAMVYLTEITSNTASTATFLPVLAAVAVGLELNVAILTVPAALGASMAFMMPVATPPNAIVFAYEPLHLADMVYAGFLLNIIAVAVGFALFVIIGPGLFGFAF